MLSDVELNNISFACLCFKLTLHLEKNVGFVNLNYSKVILGLTQSQTLTVIGANIYMNCQHLTESVSSPFTEQPMPGNGQLLAQGRLSLMLVL